MCVVNQHQAGPLLASATLTHYPTHRSMAVTPASREAGTAGTPVACSGGAGTGSSADGSSRCGGMAGGGAGAAMLEGAGHI